MITCGTYGSNPQVLPEKLLPEYGKSPDLVPRSPGIMAEWFAAIKTGGKSTTDIPRYSGTLTELMLLGNVALRFKDENGVLRRDPEKMESPDFPEASPFVHEEYRPGWSLGTGEGPALNLHRGVPEFPGEVDLSRTIAFSSCAVVAFFFVLGGLAPDAVPQMLPKLEWPIHDLTRPLPSVFDPGPAGRPVAPPRGAVVLFGGKNLDQWVGTKGGPARWKIEKGYTEVVPRSGSIQTARDFGDCHFHVEWATPAQVKGSGQARGNSGVILMNLYEVQILDSYDNKTYADGSAAAIYGQYPPLLNVSRKPGEWQTFDIIFRAPRFDAAKNLVSPAIITVFHNGMVVQNNSVVVGPTALRKDVRYTAHPEKLPIQLQDHESPVRFRMIWLREL